MHISWLLGISLAVTWAAELGMYLLPGLWPRRRVAAGLLIGVSSVVSGLVLAANLTLAGGLFGLILAYRVLNLLRVIENRMQPKYLRRVTARTSRWLAGFTLVCILLPHVLPKASVTVVILVAAQLVAASFLLISSRVAIRRSRYHTPADSPVLKDLPTVTVAIPARNETSDLVECLQSVLASNYPKLEVLVLDDCSQTNFSEIIGQFAHDGVRFISGEPPKASWLPKNQAYDALADAATGQYVLFCGVDIRFQPESISQLVHYALTNQYKMLTVLPQRTKPTGLQLIQPMRYWWELAMPRFLMHQPPSLASCWLIERQSLQRLGKFDAVRRRVRPETYFAREIHSKGHYGFVRANTYFIIQSLKTNREQFDTVIRVRYPELHKRPEMTLLLGLAEIGLLLLPFPRAISFWAGGNLWLAAASSLAALGLIIVQVSINHATHVQRSWLSYVSFPLLILTELYLINESMRRYEFDEVVWKGRNVCLPVMHEDRK